MALPTTALSGKASRSFDTGILWMTIGIGTLKPTPPIAIPAQPKTKSKTASWTFFLANFFGLLTLV